jgi:hypothetical protein
MKCNHNEHPAIWNHITKKWICMNCNKEQKCNIKLSNNAGVNPCCPDYPHK